MNTLRNTLENWIQYRWVQHTTFWLTIFLIAPITSEGTEGMRNALIFRGVGMPIKILATYTLVYFQLPLVTNQRKYLLFFLSLCLSVVFFTLLYRVCNVHIAERLTNPSGERESVFTMVEQLDVTILWYVFRTYGTAFLFLFVKMFKDQNARKQKIEALEKEKAITELQFLRAQVHPHFLFNTLNNIYALTLTKSDKAPEMVAKLADIMDYMLGQAKYVPISQEVKLIEDYLGLERIRYGDRVQLSFQYQIEDMQVKMLPLVLISLVENAFKHGVSQTIGKASVEISLTEKNGTITFEVRNTKPPTPQKDNTGHTKGIGIQNVRKQLDLLYPSGYVWEVKDETDSYWVRLVLDHLES